MRELSATQARRCYWHVFVSLKLAHNSRGLLSHLSWSNDKAWGRLPPRKVASLHRARRSHLWYRLRLCCLLQDAFSARPGTNPCRIKLALKRQILRAKQRPLQKSSEVGTCFDSSPMPCREPKVFTKVPQLVWTRPLETFAGSCPGHVSKKDKTLREPQGGLKGHDLLTLFHVVLLFLHIPILHLRCLVILALP